MILVDTSVWIDHLRTGDPKLASLLQNGHVLSHPWVIGELALGHLTRRGEILGLLLNLPQAQRATDTEVLAMIEKNHLFGLGIGYGDAHLLAATALTAESGLWTHDQRLASVAVRLGLGGRSERNRREHLSSHGGTSGDTK